MVASTRTTPETAWLPTSEPVGTPRTTCASLPALNTYGAPFGDGGDWSLLLYTDGLIEGWSGLADGDRLGVEGLSALLAARERDHPAALPLWLISQAEQRNGGPLADDVALLLMLPSRQL